MICYMQLRRERLARYSNHVTFLTKCRTSGIIPNGLRVALPVLSRKANQIAVRTSQALLRERISEGHRQKTTISRQISRLESHLSQSLALEQWSRLDSYCHDAAQRVHRAVKEKQSFKFNQLQHQKSQQPLSQATLDRSKLVVNLSSRPLSPMEEEVLALGLSFAIAPSRIPYEDIIAATEATARRLDHKAADSLRLGVSAALRQAKPPKPNLTFQQRKALHNLKNDTNIVIIPADKGRATVIMDKSNYTHKMIQTLSDDKYRTLRRDPTVKVENRIASALKHLTMMVTLLRRHVTF